MVVAFAVGCTADPPVQREWTPDDHGQPQSADPSRVPTAEGPAAEPVSPAEAEARAARALFNVSCAGCHGRDGRGGGASKPPGAQMPDLTAAALQSSRSDAQWEEAIAKGRGLMPAFGEKINAEGIVALVRHVRTLAGGSPVAPSAPPVQPVQPVQPVPNPPSAQPAAAPPTQAPATGP